MLDRNPLGASSKISPAGARIVDVAGYRLDIVFGNYIYFLCIHDNVEAFTAEMIKRFI